jgi:hypothetical protein
MVPAMFSLGVHSITGRHDSLNRLAGLSGHMPHTGAINQFTDLLKPYSFKSARDLQVTSFISIVNVEHDFRV